MTPEPVLDERGPMPSLTLIFTTDDEQEADWDRLLDLADHAYYAIERVDPRFHILKSSVFYAGTGPESQHATRAALTEALRERDEALLYKPCAPCLADDHANCTGYCPSMCCALTEAEHRADESQRDTQDLRAALTRSEREVSALRAGGILLIHQREEAEHRAERYREALEELWNAVHGYLNERDIDRYDLMTTDRGDNLNVALVHADRELATTAGPGGTQ